MAEEPRPAKDYRFLHWRYSPNLRLLSGPDGDTRLKPLLDRLLRRLMDDPGQMLVRDQLIAQVWTRREVNDEVLSRAIAELRSLLGDDARDPRFIETLPKGGYRWIPPTTLEYTQAEPIPVNEAVQATSIADARRRNLLWTGATLLLLASLAGAIWLTQSDRNDERATLAVDLLSARPLTSDARLEYDARFDSMGRVVYIRADPKTGISELILLDPASKAERVLWQDPEALRHPAPAPDSREIAVMRLTDQACELWSIAVVDARRSKLGECSDSGSGGLEWSDGGNELLYTGTAMDDQHASGLMLLDLRNSSHRRLTTPNVTEGAHVDPRISADGKTLVYASEHDNERQLWKTDWPLLQQRHALLKRPEPVYGHAFEPEGDTLWIAGDLTLYRALHRLRTGGMPELIGGRGARSIDLSAKGAAVWSEAIYDADIWLQTGRDAAWTAIARSNRYESQPEFSADGSKLALTSNRSGTESVLVYDLLDGNTHQLSLNAAYRWVRPTWSAREPALIITAYEDQQTRLYRYALDGDILSPLAHVEPGAFHGFELADRLLYLMGHGTESSMLMQLQNGSSQSENAGIGPVATFRASAGWIVWIKPGSNNLQAAPLSDLTAVREIKREGMLMDEAFALAENSVFYVDKAQLWSIELPDGTARAMPIEHLPNGSGSNLAVSNGGAMAVVTTTSLSIDLMFADAPVKEP